MQVVQKESEAHHDEQSQQVVLHIFAPHQICLLYHCILHCDSRSRQCSCKLQEFVTVTVLKTTMHGGADNMVMWQETTSLMQRTSSQSHQRQGKQQLLTYPIVNEAIANDALKAGPEQEAGPQQYPGPIHDQFGMALRTLKAMLDCCCTWVGAVIYY